MELVKSILAVIGGGATGYITNDYAVKMIFRKYGPLGGMIIDTREQFVESVSELVERDIINNRTIENELSKYEFRRVFYNLISDVLKKYLYKNTDDIDIIKIPGMRDSINNFVGFYKENASELSKEFSKSLLDTIALEDMLSEQQRLFLAEKLWDILAHELAVNDTVELILKGFYRENSEKSIDEFINPKIFKIIARNLNESTNNFHESLQADFEIDIDNVIKKMYTVLECKETLKRFEAGVKEKTLVELLGKDSVQNISNEILKRGIKVLRSPEGKELIQNFIIKVFSILKSINVSILSILDEGVRSNLESYMREHLPGIVEKIIRWIKSNRDEIDNLINKSVDDVLEEGSSGFFDVRGKAKKWLKNTFIENIAKRYEIVGYIIKYIEEGTDTRAMSIEVTETIINYIGKNTVSQIITDLEEKKLLRPEYLVSLINNNIDTHISKMNVSIFDEIFQRQIGDVIKIDFSKYLEAFLTTTISEQIKTKFLFSEKSTKLLQREVTSKIRDINSEKVGQLWNNESCEDLIKLCKEQIVKSIKSAKTTMINNLAQEIHSEIAGKKIGTLCTDDMFQKVGKTVADKSLYFVREKIAEVQNQPIKEIYDNLNTKKDSIKNLTGLAIELSNKNMHVLLEGKIRETVAANLSKLPDTEIQKMVEDFMGKELKPINMFGAILGAATGLLTYFAESGLTLASNYTFELAWTIAVYSFVGYITNVIALKMIFQPYYEKKFMGMKLPFAPGVVTKQKPRFANSMGEFVDKSLLKASSVNAIFQEKRLAVEQNFIDSISADNYKLLEQVLIENNELIAAKVSAVTLQFIDKNKETFFDNMVGLLQDVNLVKFDYKKLEVAIQDKGSTYIKNTDTVISVELNKILQSGESLHSILPEFVKSAIYNSINQMLDDKIEVIAELINDDSKMEKIVEDFAKSFDILIEKNISEQLTEQQSDNFKQAVSSYFINKVQSSEVRETLIEWIEEEIAKELTPEKRIGDLFGGMLVKVFHQNVEFILDNIVGVAQSKLQNNDDSIKREVYTLFRQSSGTIAKGVDFVLDIESSIYGVVDDLIYSKLPDYINRKEYELKEILTEFINDKVARSRIVDIGIEVNTKGIMNIIDRLLASKQAASSLALLSDNLVESVLRIPIKQLLHIASINNIFDIYRAFAVEIKDVRMELTANVNDKRPLLVREIGALVKNIVEKELLPISVNQLTVGITPEDIDKTVKNIVIAITDSDIFNKQLAVYSKNIIGEFKYKELNELLDFKIVKQDSMAAFNKLAADEQVKDKLTVAFKDVLKVFLTNFNSIVTTDTKEFALNIMVKSLLDALEDHLLNIINAVNIQEVTEREINRMEPKEIEDMFNSFAKPYFRKIEAYGLMGGGIGVATSLLSKLATVLK